MQTVPQPSDLAAGQILVRIDSYDDGDDQFNVTLTYGDARGSWEVETTVPGLLLPLLLRRQQPLAWRVGDSCLIDMGPDASSSTRGHPKQDDSAGTDALLDRVNGIADALLNGEDQIRTRFGVKRRDGVAEMILSTFPFDALDAAESFMRGFEDDPLQEGINEKLKSVRDALALRHMLDT